MSYVANLMKHKWVFYSFVAALLVIEFTVLYQGFVAGAAERLEKEEYREQDLKQTYHQKVNRAFVLDELKLQLAEAEKDLSTYLQVLPASIRIDKVVADLSEVADRNNVTLLDIRFEEERPKEFYSEVRVNVKLKGAFKDIVFALEDRLSFPGMRVSRLESYYFSADSADSVRFEGTLVLYRYIEEDEINQKHKSGKGS